MSFTIKSIVAGPGEVGICPMPGRSGSYRDDLQIISTWTPGLVLSVITSGEMAETGMSGLPDDLAVINCDWLHLPVDDFGAPKAATRNLWPVASERAQDILQAKRRVLVHCKAGCGRSGMTILRLLLEMGEQPETALARLRAVRPCAIETPEQMQWAISGYKGATIR